MGKGVTVEERKLSQQKFEEWRSEQDADVQLVLADLRLDVKYTLAEVPDNPMYFYICGVKPCGEGPKLHRHILGDLYTHDGVFTGYLDIGKTDEIVPYKWDGIEEQIPDEMLEKEHGTYVIMQQIEIVKEAAAAAGLQVEILPVNEMTSEMVEKMKLHVGDKPVPVVPGKRMEH